MHWLLQFLIAANVFGYLRYKKAPNPESKDRIQTRMALLNLALAAIALLSFATIN